MYLVGLHAKYSPPVELRLTSGVLSCLVGLNAKYILTCPLFISGKKKSQVKSSQGWWEGGVRLGLVKCEVYLVDSILGTYASLVKYVSRVKIGGPIGSTVHQDSPSKHQQTGVKSGVEKI